MSRAQLTSTVEQNTGGAVAPYVAGKNAVINGGMDIWQRGTSGSALIGTQFYSADRMFVYSGSNVTATQDTSVLAPGARYSLKCVASATQQIFLTQVIETANAIQFAGQTVTLSCYVAGTSGNTNNINVSLQYSTTVDAPRLDASYTSITASVAGNILMTTSMQKVSATFVVPSNAKSLQIFIGNNAVNYTSGQGVYYGNVQLELGSVATPFSRAGGTLQGELALCQRYYFRTNQAGNSTTYAVGHCESTTVAIFPVPLPVPMRTLPASMDYAGLRVYSGSTVGTTGTFVYTSAYSTTTNASVLYTHGSLLFTAGYAAELDNANTGAAYLGFSAEL